MSVYSDCGSTTLKPYSITENTVIENWKHYYKIDGISSGNFTAGNFIIDIKWNNETELFTDTIDVCSIMKNCSLVSGDNFNINYNFIFPSGPIYGAPNFLTSVIQIKDQNSELVFCADFKYAELPVPTTTPTITPSFPDTDNKMQMYGFVGSILGIFMIFAIFIIAINRDNDEEENFYQSIV